MYPCLNQMKTLVIDTSLPSYNSFLQDDIITQESTNSTCVIVDIQQNSTDSNYLNIRVNDIKGEFQVGAGHPWSAQDPTKLPTRRQGF